MLSTRVQRSPCLVGLVWLVDNSCLARLVGPWFIKSIRTA